MTHILRYQNKTFYKIVGDNIIFKMFQSLKFKYLLGLSYAANIGELLEKTSDEDSFIHLGVQILTIPEISLKIFENDRLRGTLLNMFAELVSLNKHSLITDRTKFFWFNTDMKYMLKAPTIEFLLYKNGLEQFLDIYLSRCMSDAIKIRDSHIFMGSEGYYYDGLDFSYMSLK